MKTNKVIDDGLLLWVLLFLGVAVFATIGIIDSCNGAQIRACRNSCAPQPMVSWSPSGGCVCGAKP